MGSVTWTIRSPSKAAGSRGGGDGQLLGLDAVLLVVKNQHPATVRTSSISRIRSPLCRGRLERERMGRASCIEVQSVYTIRRPLCKKRKGAGRCNSWKLLSGPPFSSGRFDGLLSPSDAPQHAEGAVPRGRPLYNDSIDPSLVVVADIVGASSGWAARWSPSGCRCGAPLQAGRPGGRGRGCGHGASRRSWDSSARSQAPPSSGPGTTPWAGGAA